MGILRNKVGMKASFSLLLHSMTIPFGQTLQVSEMHSLSLGWKSVAVLSAGQQLEKIVSLFQT